MNVVTEFLNWLSGVVWGPPTLILIVGTGLLLTFRLGFYQFSSLPYALKLAFSKNQDSTSRRRHLPFPIINDGISGYDWYW